MNNHEDHKKFINREKKWRLIFFIYLIVFTILSLMNFILKIYLDAKNGNEQEWVKTLCLVVSRVVFTNVFFVLIFMIIIKVFLLRTMAQFHREEYEIHRLRMILFFVLEGMIIFC